MNFNLTVNINANNVKRKDHRKKYAVSAISERTNQLRLLNFQKKSRYYGQNMTKPVSSLLFEGRRKKKMFQQTCTYKVGNSMVFGLRIF